MGLLDKLMGKSDDKAGQKFGGTVRYQPNDPGTPELAVSMDLPQPPSPCPPYVVEGFTGADGPPGSIEGQACGVYTTMTLSLQHCQGVLEKPILKWPSLSQLFANPRSGKMFNAYYDRYYLNFFFDQDPKTGEMVYTCESTDVVAHELGHAILDAIRPDLWGVQSVEIQAFHEAFGDINAILTELTMENMVENVLQETGGDLMKSNVIARIGEQMGLAIYHAKGHDGNPKNFALRSLLNTFQYVAPEILPTRAPDDTLAGEPHSFSRVFAGGFYDALALVYEAEKATGKTPVEAIRAARNKMARVIFNAVRTAPVTTRFFGSVLKAMIVYDKLAGVGIGDALLAGFARHGIEPTDGLMISAPADVKYLLNGGNRMETARVNDFDQDRTDPLFSCIVELANAHVPGQFVAENMGDLQQAIQAAKHSLMVIRDHGRVGTGKVKDRTQQKEFSVVDGRLVRNYFNCWFHQH